MATYAAGDAARPAPGGDLVRDILERAQAGDRQAFAELYDRYFKTVYNYVYLRVAGNRALAEDITSETFLRALRRLDSFSYTGKDPAGWFITIARNILLDHVKSARARFEVPTADMVSADQVTEGPENQVLGTLAAADALALVQQLPRPQAEVVVLRILKGLSVAEVAAMMGKSEGAIKALQHRAVRRLAALLPDPEGEA